MWKYDIVGNTWEFLSGAQTRNTRADYTTPLPGGISKHAMVIDGLGSSIYIHGGEGYAGGLGS